MADDWNSGPHDHDHEPRWGDGYLDGRLITNGGGGRRRERRHSRREDDPDVDTHQATVYAVSALDMAYQVIANWRAYHGNESTYGKCQWVDGWYWQFTYQGNEDITTYYNATQAADASPMHTTYINDPAIQAGDLLYWWYAEDGHVATAIGWDGPRLLITHTSNNSDVVIDLGNNFKVAHADTLGLTFRGASHHNGNNIQRAGLMPYIVGAPPTPVPVPLPTPEGSNMLLIKNASSPEQLILVTVDGGHIRGRYLEDPYERAIFSSSSPALPITACDDETFAGFLKRIGYEYGADIPLVPVTLG